jgi:cysteine desulfurase
MPYFDHNATSPLSPVARDAWLRAQDELWQNPSSPTRAAARVRNALEAARARLASLLDARPEQIIFNSGATEGASTVIAWLARVSAPGAHIALNPTEHPCILESAGRFFPDRIHWLPKTLTLPETLPLNPTAIQINAANTAAVAIMAANNETGVIHPWRKIAAACRAARVPHICDATQWLGKLPASGLAKSAGWLIASAHKFGGPKGAGFIKIADHAESFVAHPGGTQEHGHRGGTENYPAIAAMVAALEDAEMRKMHLEPERLRWRAEFERTIAQTIPGTQIVAQNRPPETRLWNTVMLLMPREENTRWVAQLDKRGFQVSTGSACATGKGGPSRVLAAMGIPPDAARRAVRVSSSWETTREDWQALAAAFAGIFW